MFSYIEDFFFIILINCYNDIIGTEVKAFSYKL